MFRVKADIKAAPHSELISQKYANYQDDVTASVFPQRVSIVQFVKAETSLVLFIHLHSKGNININN